MSVNPKKVVRVVEGTCRSCQTHWKIEFFSGEEVWELRVCPTCWEGLNVEVGRVGHDDKALLLTSRGEPLEL